MRLKAAALVAATLVVGWGVPLSGVASADPPPPGPPPGPLPGPAPQTTMDHDGTYAMGADILPGIYSSAGPVGNGACYWKRINGSNTVDNAMSRKPQVVSIDPADTAFKTDGCQTWQLTPDAAVPPTGGLPPQIAGAILGGIGNAINNGARQPDASPPHP